MSTGTIYAGGMTFDYAHMIPGHPKCGRLHGHTSRVRVTVTGEVDASGMVVDFAVLKYAVEDVLECLDHRLLAGQSHVESSGAGRVVLKYERSNGHHRFDLPSDEVVLLDGEPAIETITDLVLQRLAEAMAHRGVRLDRIEVECTEGDAKGAIARSEAAAF
jgi:6-pyruvoyltetrahydropterin/6-carboxytetrahydropterin synthase